MYGLKRLKIKKSNSPITIGDRNYSQRKVNHGSSFRRSLETSTWHKRGQDVVKCGCIGLSNALKVGDLIGEAVNGPLQGFAIFGRAAPLRGELGDGVPDVAQLTDEREPVRKLPLGKEGGSQLGNRQLQLVNANVETMVTHCKMPILGKVKTAAFRSCKYEITRPNETSGYRFHCEVINVVLKFLYTRKMNISVVFEHIKSAK
jgi:hypothetical protein